MGRTKKEEITENTEELKKTKKVNSKASKTKEVKNTKITKKEKFDIALEEIKGMKDAIKLHENVKKAVSKEEVDNNYLSYIENSLEDKLFNDTKFDKISPKVLIEVVCPELVNFENIEVEKLDIQDVGKHFEEKKEYIDKICVYDGKFICLFGVEEANNNQAIKYEARKFIRQDMLEAVCQKFQEGQKIQIEQYDEYYVVNNEDGIKVFSERKVVSLIKLEETIFDKIKAKISSFCTNLFTKKTYLPNVELLYDSNPNRLKDFKHLSKIDAKNRMKALLRKEREITRVVNN